MIKRNIFLTGCLALDNKIIYNGFVSLNNIGRY